MASPLSSHRVSLVLDVGGGNGTPSNRPIRSLPHLLVMDAYDHLEPRYLMALAASAQMLGRYADAIQHYGTAAVLMLDDPAPLLHSAECCIAIQQMEGAAEALRMAIGLIDQGKQQKKIVPVKGYVKQNGTKVSPHRRSTPN